MKSKRTINRNVSSGEFASKAETLSNPSGTVTETVNDNSALTLLADHVRDFVNQPGIDIDKWKVVFAVDLERIDGAK